MCSRRLLFPYIMMLPTSLRFSSAMKAHQFFTEESWDSFKQIFDTYMFEASKVFLKNLFYDLYFCLARGMLVSIFLSKPLKVTCSCPSSLSIDIQYFFWVGLGDGLGIAFPF